MLQVRHVVRHGKGFIVFALARRCLPAHGATAVDLPRNLNTNSSSSRSEAGASLSAVSSTGTSSSLGDGEVLKAGKSSKDLDSSRGNDSSDRSKDGAAPGKSLKDSAKDLVSQFTKGTKVLWVDFKASRQTSARKKAGEALTFQEDRQLRQVRVPSIPLPILGRPTPWFSPRCCMLLRMPCVPSKLFSSTYTKTKGFVIYSHRFQIVAAEMFVSAFVRCLFLISRVSSAPFWPPWPSSHSSSSASWPADRIIETHRVGYHTQQPGRCVREMYLRLSSSLRVPMSGFSAPNPPELLA